MTGCFSYSRKLSGCELLLIACELRCLPPEGDGGSKKRIKSEIFKL